MKTTTPIGMHKGKHVRLQAGSHEADRCPHCKGGWRWIFWNPRKERYECRCGGTFAFTWKGGR